MNSLVSYPLQPLITLEEYQAFPRLRWILQGEWKIIFLGNYRPFSLKNIDIIVNTDYSY